MSLTIFAKAISYSLITYNLRRTSGIGDGSNVPFSNPGKDSTTYFPGLNFEVDQSPIFKYAESRSEEVIK